MAVDTSNLGMGGNPFLGQANPNLQSIIDMSSKDLVDNYNRTTQPAFNAAMVRSGSFGNSGVDAANQVAQGQLQTNLGDLSSKLRFNDYQNQQGMYQWQEGQNRALYNDAYSQNQQNLQTGVGLLGMLGGLNSQDITNTTNQQNTPLNYLTQFSNLAGSAGRGGQTSNMTTSGGGSSPLTSALGGAQLGNSFGNWLSTQGGYAANPASSNTSNWVSNPSNSWYTGTSGMGD